MNRLLSICYLLFVLVACDGDDEKEKLRCDNYYLAGDNEASRLFYNTDGLLSEILYEDDTIYIFEYNDQKQVEFIEAVNFTFNFHYEDGVLVAMRQHSGLDGFNDSIAIEYDDQERIVERNYYSDKLYKSLVNTYVGQNTSKMEFYDFNNTTLQLEKTKTILYTYDNNPTPYPAELQLTNSLMYGLEISVNNIIRLTVVGIGTSTTSDIRYNTDGYPVSIYGIQFVYTCEPTPRGVQ
jgi:hypothetical protein